MALAVWSRNTSKMETTNDQAEDLSESNNSCTSTSTSASEPSFVDPYKTDYGATRADGPADLSVTQSKDYPRSDGKLQDTRLFFFLWILIAYEYDRNTFSVRWKFLFNILQN